MRPTVVICQHRLLHYRVQFFEDLRRRCNAEGINLELVHGQASEREARKNDEGYLNWARRVNNLILPIFGRDLLWQPLPHDLHKPDLLILMQENRLLSNYVHLIGARSSHGTRVAYWGHGANFQSTSPNGIRERWKRFWLDKVDWWFAYTQSTVEILLQAGFPASRISRLDNAIDNVSFKNAFADVSCDELEVARRSLGIAQGTPVALFCGSLYAEKRLDVLITAAETARKRFPELSLVIIGDGPAKQFVDAAATDRPWIKVLGVKTGREKALYFKLASLILNPGAVGLHVLDSFCAGIPMLTMADARHGPEIAYLEHGVNGLCIDGGIAEYSAALINLLSSPDEIKRLGRAALQASEKYTLANMVSNFMKGITEGLEAGKHIKENDDARAS